MTMSDTSRLTRRSLFRPSQSALCLLPLLLTVCLVDAHTRAVRHRHHHQIDQDGRQQQQQHHLRPARESNASLPEVPKRITRNGSCGDENTNYRLCFFTGKYSTEAQISVKVVGTSGCETDKTSLDNSKYDDFESSQTDCFTLYLIDVGQDIDGIRLYQTYLPTQYWTLNKIVVRYKFQEWRCPDENNINSKTEDFIKCYIDHSYDYSSAPQCLQASPFLWFITLLIVRYALH